MGSSQRTIAARTRRESRQGANVEDDSYNSEEQEVTLPNPGFWHLRLYVAGTTPKSLTALKNLKKICEDHLAGRYDIEIVDLLKTPALAKGDQILAIPTLVRRLPPPMRKIIGDLSNTERVLVGLDLKLRTSLRAEETAS